MGIMDSIGKVRMCTWNHDAINSFKHGENAWSVSFFVFCCCSGCNWRRLIRRIQREQGQTSEQDGKEESDERLVRSKTKNNHNLLYQLFCCIVDTCRVCVSDLEIEAIERIEQIEHRIRLPTLERRDPPHNDRLESAQSLDPLPSPCRPRLASSRRARRKLPKSCLTSSRSSLVSPGGRLTFPTQTQA